MKPVLRILALGLTLTASTAFAHLELGTYRGTGADAGLPCSFEVKAIAFEGGLKNPLNERVMIEYGNLSRTLQHPPVVDVSNLSASFVHEALQSVIGTATGAEAFVLKMNSESHKPDYFVFIQDDWKNEQRTAIHCENLQHLR